MYLQNKGKYQIRQSKIWNHSIDSPNFHQNLEIEFEVKSLIQLNLSTVITRAIRKFIILKYFALTSGGS